MALFLYSTTCNLYYRMPPDRQTYMAHASCPDDTFNFAWMMVSYLLPFSGSTKKKEGGKQKIKRRKKKVKGAGLAAGKFTSIYQ